MDMGKISNVLRYLILNYPYERDLSKTRVTKMVYLADWYYSLKYYKQITDIKWYFDHYGPYVPDVFEAALDDDYLKIKKSKSLYGNTKRQIILNEKCKDDVQIQLVDKEKKVLDKVIEDTKNLTWRAFITKIYETYPIREGMKYKHLNLVECAKKLNLNK